MSCEKIVRGQTLRELLDKSKSLTDRLRLLPSFELLCDGLAAAHEKGRTHNALHPGNVLVSDLGEVALLDGAMDAAYAAPESKDAARPGPTADVYSLGAILYEILTGKKPFVLKEGQTGKVPESITVVEPSAPSEYATVCRRCVRPDAGARYPSAKPLAEELHKLRLKTGDRPEEPAQNDAALKYKALFAAAVTAFIIVLALGVFAYRSAVKNLEEARATMQDQQSSLTSAKTELEEELNRTRTRLAEVETLVEQHSAARAAAERAQLAAETALADAQRTVAEFNSKVSGAPADASPSTPAPGAFTPTFSQPLPAAEPTAVADASATPPPPATPAPAPPKKPAPTPEVAPQPAAAEPAPSTSTPTPTPAPAAAQPAPAAETTPASEPAAKSDERTEMRPAGITKADFLRSMPDLLASLKEEKSDNTQVVVVRVTDESKAAGVQRLGLKDGDIITRVNRSPVAKAEDARRALANVSNDPGFSVRITRGGQSGWMRINFSDAQPPAPPKPKEEPAAPPATPPAQQPEQPAPEVQEAAPADNAPAPEAEEQPTDQSQEQGQPADQDQPQEQEQPEKQDQQTGQEQPENAEQQ